MADHSAAPAPVSFAGRVWSSWVEKAALCGWLGCPGRVRGCGVDGCDVEQAGEADSAGPCAVDEGWQEERGGDGVLQRAVGLASAGEAFYLGVES